MARSDLGPGKRVPEGQTFGLVRGDRRRPPQRDEPALVVLARSACQRYLQVKSRDVPGLPRSIADDLEIRWAQEIFRRAMIAMRVLDPVVERELVVRAHVQLDRPSDRH